MRWTVCCALLLSGVLPAMSAQTTPANPGITGNPNDRKPGVVDNLLSLLDDPEPEHLRKYRDLDVAVLMSSGTAPMPLPFLRLTQRPGQELKADLAVWWRQPAGVPDDRLPARRRCNPPGTPAAVCVAPVDIAGTHDWMALLADIYASRTCELFTHNVGVTLDAGDLFVRVDSRRGGFQAFSCNAPRAIDLPKNRAAARVLTELEQLARDAHWPR